MIDKALNCRKSLSAILGEMKLLGLQSSFIIHYKAIRLVFMERSLTCVSLIPIWRFFLNPINDSVCFSAADNNFALAFMHLYV